MDNKYIKEKSRYAYIRERAKTLKEKPKTVSQPLKHMAIKEAKQHYSQSRQEENSYAVDEVESNTAYIADTGGQALKKARREFAVKFSHRKESAAGNTSPEETHFKQSYKEQGKLLARRSTIKQTRAKAERKAALADKIKKAIQRSVRESGESLLLLGGAMLIAIIPLLAVLGIVSSIFTVDADKAPVSDEVKAYAGVIQIYAMEHGIPEYAELIMAVMMQESGGRGNDPMQASESAFNTEYPNTPDGITDPEYSINVGIQALADVLSLAGVTDIDDTESLYIALQAYNFGPGYIAYAYNNGGHSELVALAFSEMMAERMGWESYGDPYYVQHVMRYVAVR